VMGGFRVRKKHDASLASRNREPRRRQNSSSTGGL
jgi:hypothetical protein